MAGGGRLEVIFHLSPFYSRARLSRYFGALNRTEKPHYRWTSAAVAAGRSENSLIKFLSGRSILETSSPTPFRAVFHATVSDPKTKTKKKKKTKLKMPLSQSGRFIIIYYSHDVWTVVVVVFIIKCILVYYYYVIYERCFWKHRTKGKKHTHTHTPLNTGRKLLTRVRVSGLWNMLAHKYYIILKRTYFCIIRVYLRGLHDIAANNYIFSSPVGESNEFVFRFRPDPVRIIILVLACYRI